MNQDQILDQIETPPSLAEIALQAIKKAIMENRLIPDVIYNEKALAEELGFSKTPVREALTALSVRGFVTILPRKGFQVRANTPKNIQDMYDFRRTVERAAILKVVPTISDESISHLETIIENLSSTEDPTQLGNLDRDFHSYLVSLSDNFYIIEALNNVWELCAWIAVKAITTDSRNHEPILLEHRNILKWIKARNAEQAAEAMIGHLLRAEASWFEQNRSENE